MLCLGGRMNPEPPCFCVVVEGYGLQAGCSVIRTICLWSPPAIPVRFQCGFCQGPTVCHGCFLHAGIQAFGWPRLLPTQLLSSP